MKQMILSSRVWEPGEHYEEREREGESKREKRGERERGRVIERERKSE